MRNLRAHLTYANVMSTLAALFALTGGVAYAANTIGSNDIIDGEVKTPDLAANAVTSPKIADGQVTGADIGQAAVAGAELKNDAITSQKVLNETLVGNDVLNNTLKGVDIDESTLSSIGGGGPAGGDLAGTYPNPQIAADAVDAPEIANRAVGAGELEFFEVVDASTPVPPGGGVGSVTAVCPDGTQLISGGAFFPFPSGDLSASFASNFSPGAWNAQGQNNGNAEQTLLARAFCLREAS
jgi:hypothetical protein